MRLTLRKIRPDFMTILALGDLSIGSVLVFGGPYSNLAATRAMQAKAQSLDIPPERTICTGDLVAYCAEPAETVDLIRDWGIPVVMGNCEESLAVDASDCGCGFDEGSACSLLSVTWYRYATALINESQRRWMADLPREISFQFGGFDFKVIHAGAASINQFVFESDSSADKLTQLDMVKTDVIIGGHSGIPFGQKIGHQCWLNSGVIGMPANDGSSDVWYLLLAGADSGFTASWHRLVYDHKLSQRSTKAAGMHEYAKALGDGLWPSLDVLPEAERQQQGVHLQPQPLSMLRT
jgi:predicted phosphodiesterase